MTTAVKKLAIWKMSQDAIPANGGLMDGVRFLSTKGVLSQAMVEATAWVDDAIAAVRMAPDADPNWSDDDIAQQIIDQLIDKVCTCKSRPHLPGCPARSLEKPMTEETKSEAALNRELLAERINTSVERLLSSCERNDQKRIAYWAGTSARHLSELVRECLALCPEQRIIT